MFREEPTGLGAGQDWAWREDRIQDLLSAEDADFVVPQRHFSEPGKVYPQFDHIVLLSAPPEVIVERLVTRTTNPYGKRPEKVERTLQLQTTIEPLLRRSARFVVDTSVPLDEVVAAIVAFVRLNDSEQA
jgi:dephospho-CoA kinase